MKETGKDDGVDKETVQLVLQLVHAMDRRQIPSLVRGEQDELHSQRYCSVYFFPPPLYASLTPSLTLLSADLFLPTEQLKSTKITGDKNIGAIQDGVAEGVGGQFSSGGLLGGVGDATSKEGVNRAERGDTGPVDKDDLGAKAEGGKGWGQTLSGGLVSGGKK